MTSDKSVGRGGSGLDSRHGWKQLEVESTVLLGGRSTYFLHVACHATFLTAVHVMSPGYNSRFTIYDIPIETRGKWVFSEPYFVLGSNQPAGLGYIIYKVSSV
jgi:hypothetical protein